MKDWRGTTLKVGDLVVYNVRHGSNNTLNEGLITELLVDKVQIKWLRSNNTYDQKFRKSNTVQVGIKGLTMIGRGA